MTEGELYAKMKPWLENTGGMPSRLENAIGSGMPDVVYARGPLMFIELKIEKSFRIKLEPYQYSFAMRMIPRIFPHLYWFAVQSEEGVKMFQWSDLYLLPKEDIKEGGVSIYIKGAKPRTIVNNKQDISSWLEEHVLNG